ncbi:ABC transporter permease [Clostridium gasigenes]|uniref:oligopeptide ABC transporter permease n=1 Tax=Clostridium gasigenes TaxID=94869 RepID=UPI001C0CA044|nr:oligopeptide ABC transporter permease [Clostridium gasigenes]MBU3131198.1 ABC transporter permease [Clostridium gasigenes]
MDMKKKKNIYKKENNEVEKIKVEKVHSPEMLVLMRVKKNKLAMVGFGILIIMILFCVVGPMFTPYEQETMSFAIKKQPPSFAHWFGTDLIGRDILTRLMYAGRVSLLVGFVAVIIEIAIGGILGAIAGYYGGFVDSIIMRIVDIFLCIPFLPILIVLGATLSNLDVDPDKRIFFVMFIIGILSWPTIARLVRGQILSLREQEFMQAAEALGLTDSRKIFKHLLPNVIPSIIVSATLGIGGAIMTESALSYLGMGVAPPNASWGNMIQSVNNFADLMERPWLWVPPGICIFLTVMAINLLGDGLRDALDPKLKK